MASLAVPVARDVAYQLWASQNPTLEPVTDVLLGNFSVPFTTANNEVVDTRTIAPPAALGPGRWYVIAVLDPQNRIREVDENNNLASSADFETPRQFLNAFDFTVSSLRRTSAASTVRLGDVVAVEFDLVSEGLSFSGFVEFSVFFSPDELFDFGDFLVANGRAFVQGTGLGNDRTRVNFSFNVPANVNSGRSVPHRGVGRLERLVPRGIGGEQRGADSGQHDGRRRGPLARRAPGSEVHVRRWAVDHPHHDLEPRRGRRRELQLRVPAVRG
ncbi:MAG: hypothetical protein HC923_06575 [Myxococcales bacterium]|nr:hypothetical protein [Myxococcales bacterium]